ncbi:hypothetical protein L596_022306 [Steinernema carpocapsae]|uniref:Uncharacterized protein n=1 Tax=Steinernema carpocapsae TaxID=34508 RepID=A0A4U5MLF8_STECR|nr:hypothetical protein L596_022306 [Steinernema carpocapsae]
MVRLTFLLLLATLLVAADSHRFQCELQRQIRLTSRSRRLRRSSLSTGVKAEFDKMQTDKSGKDDSITAQRVIIWQNKVIFISKKLGFYQII